MKSILFLLFLAIITKNHAQLVNSISISHYTYVNFHWLNTSFNKSYKNSEFSLGLGYGITTFFVPEKGAPHIHPKGKYFYQNFNFGVGYKYYLPINKVDYKIYIYDQFNFNKTPFYGNFVYFTDSAYYTKNEYSVSKNIIDNTIGLGAELRIKNNISFFTRAGLCIFRIQGSNFTKRNLKIATEFGLKFSIASKK